MPCVRNHTKARRSSLEKARDAKKEKALVNNHIVVETDQRLSTTTVVAEDKNDDDEETDYVEDATLSTEFKLKLLMSNITTLVLNFMGIDVADSSPDNVRLITSTLCSKMIESLPFFCDDVEFEDFSASDISFARKEATKQLQWKEILQFDEKKFG